MVARVGSNVGHPRLPTQMKLLKGTDRKDRRNPDEPMPMLLTDDTPPPGWLTPEAKKGWRESLPLLVGMRIATIGDQVAIGQLCVSFARWRRAYKLTHVRGFQPVYSTSTDNGSILYKEHPAVAQEERAAKQLLDALRDFGMTPASRSRVHALPGAPEAPARPVGEPPAFDEWLQSPTT